MGDVEMQDVVEREERAPAAADLLIAIPEPVGNDAIREIAARLAQACSRLAAPCKATLALPGEPAPEESLPLTAGLSQAQGLRLMHYTPASADTAAIPRLTYAAAYGEIAALAARVGARACTILGGETGFGRAPLATEKLVLLLETALEGSFDLTMPLYTTEPFDDLVNKSILYPLTSALYGQRVRNPLATEFQISAQMFPALSSGAHGSSTRQQGRLLWPATAAASRNLKICQVMLGTRRPTAADGIELSDALAQLVGPLFLNMEENAAFWQRVRGSRDVVTFGGPEAQPRASHAVDVRPMLDAFQLAAGNLREIWSLILPPITLLELKKLSRQPAASFRMEDALWARIVYDFALAHRLRNINRGHLFGAFTPLYLGWVVSYAGAVNRNGEGSAPGQIEQLARTFESEKPYLLSRWRWPDRFQP